MSALGQLRRGLGITALALAVPLTAAAQPTPDMFLNRWDSDGDDRVSRSEFKGKRRPFGSFDANGDGYITRAELEELFGKSPDARKGGYGLPGGTAAPAPATGAAEGAADVAPDTASGPVPVDRLDAETYGAFFIRQGTRAQQVARGLFETGLIADYPEDVRCPEIDHIFGEPWKGPQHGVRHMGADIPVKDGTPMLAIADGVVIAKYYGEVGYRGLEIILQHAPEDTGLPVWTYTQYAHFELMPDLEIGQRVRMGEELGPTGRTGIPGRRRQAHVHLGTFFSKTGEYVRLEHRFVPLQGHYIDPLALMRRQAPLDSHAMKALPPAERRVAIPHKRTSGEIVPPGTRIIWPYACTPRRAGAAPAGRGDDGVSSASP